MFCRQKHYHTHGFLFVLSLLAAFMLGRKSEQYGYTIVSRGCCLHDDDDSMMEEPDQNNDYPQS